MKILITGVAGFIGYNLADKLLQKKYIVYGLDNFDDYYSVNYKKRRISELKKHKNFFFKKADIRKINNKDSFFKSKKIDVVVHMAAQAGVRFSFKRPSKYIETNIMGFLNLIKFSKKLKINKIIYASSSSVYGDSNNFPLNENEELKPKNIYGISKKINEKTAELYSNIDKINFIGLRFFTVFGEWGRPDMFMMKLFKAFKMNKVFKLNNYGNHLRDFTYIEDVVKILCNLIKKKTSGHEIFNICSNKPQNILDIVKKFTFKNKTNVKLVKLHKADVLNTHGNNFKIKKYLNLKKFSKFEKSFEKTYNWYNKFNIHLIS
jgi:UDP-glucuronate 4-epimerase